MPEDQKNIKESFPSDIQTYINEAAGKVTQNPAQYRDFLKLAACVNRLGVFSQLCVYAQRPDAEAVAQQEVWKQKIHRSLIGNAKGIRLPNENEPEKKIIAFDVKDTVAGYFDPKTKAYYIDDRTNSFYARRIPPRNENDLKELLLKNAGDKASVDWEVAKDMSLTDVIRALCFQKVFEKYRHFEELFPGETGADALKDTVYDGESLADTALRLAANASAYIIAYKYDIPRMRMPEAALTGIERFQDQNNFISLQNEIKAVSSPILQLIREAVKSYNASELIRPEERRLRDNIVFRDKTQEEIEKEKQKIRARQEEKERLARERKEEARRQIEERRRAAFVSFASPDGDPEKEQIVSLASLYEKREQEEKVKIPDEEDEKVKIAERKVKVTVGNSHHGDSSKASPVRQSAPVSSVPFRPQEFKPRHCSFRYDGGPQMGELELAFTQKTKDEWEYTIRDLSGKEYQKESFINNHPSAGAVVNQKTVEIFGGRIPKLMPVDDTLLTRNGKPQKLAAFAGDRYLYACSLQQSDNSIPRWKITRLTHDFKELGTGQRFSSDRLGDLMQAIEPGSMQLGHYDTILSHRFIKEARGDRYRQDETSILDKAPYMGFSLKEGEYRSSSPKDLMEGNFFLYAGREYLALRATESNRESGSYIYAEEVLPAGASRKRNILEFHGGWEDMLLIPGDFAVLNKTDLPYFHRRRKMMPQDLTLEDGDRIEDFSGVSVVLRNEDGEGALTWDRVGGIDDDKDITFNGAFAPGTYQVLERKGTPLFKWKSGTEGKIICARPSFPSKDKTEDKSV